MHAVSARFGRAFSVVLFFLLAAGASAQSAVIVGRVFDPQAQPVSGATVTLVEARRSVLTGADGSFRFENLPPRHYHLRAESPRLGTAVGEARVAAGETRTVEVVIDPLVHAEEIVVTASADSRRESEVYQPVTVVTGEALIERLQSTLGETLNREPGVTSTSFGAGSSRPIIRGLGADRIRVLEEGVGTGDASNISPDHAVSVDPASAERIEIVRGPATLLYGSNAVGGVVNVITGRIPSYVPSEAISGSVDLRYGSVASEKSGAVTLNGGAGSFAWHGALSLRDAGNYRIPGPAEQHDEHDDEHDDHDEFTGRLENSALESLSGTVGGSWVGSRGFLGLAVTRFTTNYGVPGHAHHDDDDDHDHDHFRVRGASEDDHEEEVRIDLRQRRIDLRGELTELGLFDTVRVRLGRNTYRHDELEGDEIGTRFDNKGIEGRLEGNHRPIGRVSGTWGAQFSSNDFAAEGEEAYIPPNESRSKAVFAYEEVRGNRVDLQFGARYEHQDLKVAAVGLPDREFSGVSGSLGGLWRADSQHVVALSLARAVRLPTATELYANGPHLATNQFEIGNPDLREEEALGIDLSFRRTVGRFRGELNLFNNSFDGYIYESPTGEEEDELPIFEFVQRDARFRGVEIGTHTHLLSRGSSHLELDVSADYVRATLSGGANLPRIPPMRVAAGLRLHGPSLSAMAEVRRTFAQDDVADYESTTGGYTFLNASVGYRFFVANTIHDVMLRGMNLTNELARAHTSPLKERVPLPGRDVTLSYRVSF
ncbi:MAG TPA: TonB-dependent receptor [Thermoanaerobaculia bacterium]